MYTTKTLLKAASLAVLAAAGLGAGIGSVCAAPWDRHDFRAETLRFHHYRVVSDPFFFHGRFVVRAHDRFGRPILVQVNPYSGAFIRIL
jgi:hypothetical protein